MCVTKTDPNTGVCVCVYLFPALWGPIVPTRIEIPEISDLMGTFYFINSL